MVANDNVRRSGAFKRLLERCKKVKECPYCGAANGAVRRFGCMKIVHQKYPPKTKGEKAETLRANFHATFEKAMAMPKGSFENTQSSGADVRQLLPNAQDDLTPLRLRALFRAIPEADYALIDMSACFGKPETLLIQKLLVPPIPIRPSVDAGAAGSNEDDLTVKLADIVKVNNIIRCAMAGGKAMVKDVMEDWEYLQLQCALYLQGPGTVVLRVPTTVYVGTNYRR